MTKLKIGKISYANLFPIFYTFEKECDCSSYEFVEGVPSALNKMLGDGVIDVSPSSSIEYLRSPSLYQIINGHSISSEGPIGSIFLFSKKWITELHNSVIYVSSQSETSVVLLDIILRKFYGIQCKLQVSQAPEDSDAEAFLLIGDDALKYRKIVTRYSLLSYDLGEIWYDMTGLPFVFALWIARKELEESKADILNKFINDLNMAKDIALKNLTQIAKYSSMRAFMSEDDIVSYWKRIDYNFTNKHKRGLDLFQQYLKELSCL
jgi:chorismate dehydratase